jgi:hypothetical protein
MGRSLARAGARRDDPCAIRAGGRHYQQPRIGLACQGLKRRVNPICILEKDRNCSYLESIRCPLNQAQ